MPNCTNCIMMEVKMIGAQDTYQIRKQVLRKNIPLSHEFNGDLDENTFHIGAYYKGILIGVASFMNADSDHFSGVQYQLRGMATADEYRGFGAGKLLMDKAFEILQLRSADYLWCNARIVALDFYRKMGLKTFGKMFTLTYVGDHYVMFKKLK